MLSRNPTGLACQDPEGEVGADRGEHTPEDVAHL